jgi:hypothetical protein
MTMNVRSSSASWRKCLLLNRSALLATWPRHFPMHDFANLRMTRPSSFERLCDELERKTKRKPPAYAPRPTPQVVVEAILHGVRERGLAALKEPANQERLLRCDAAARQQINDRIEKLGVRHD